MTGLHDVVIIGAGPAGLAAAVYTGRACRGTVVLEKAVPGGQILLADRIENYPGYPEGLDPRVLMENFRSHALKFGAAIERAEALSIRREGEALFLSRLVRKTYLIHRRYVFRAERIIQDRVLGTPGIEPLRDTVVEGLNGRARLESLTLRNVRNGEAAELPVDGLFVSIGMVPNAEPVRGLVDLNEWGQIKVGPSLTTSREGIFAAGDVTDACRPQLAPAVGSGVQAALAVEDYLRRA